jgi:hypothetical protein
MIKGIRQEIFSKIKYADGSLHKTIYQNLEYFKEISSPSFVTGSKNFERFQVDKIQLIKKEQKAGFRKYQMR